MRKRIPPEKWLEGLGKTPPIKRVNTGKAAESAITALCFSIEHLGWGRIEKVDPPTKVIGKGDNRKIIFLTNPFLDYIGSFRGQPITFEVKDIDKNTMPIDVLPKIGKNGKAGKTVGLSEKQCRNLRRWHRVKCITGLVWFRRCEPRLYSGREIIDALDAGAKSLPWDGAHKVDHWPSLFNQLAKL